MVSASVCGVKGPRFESHRGRLCLSQQPLRYTALGMGCARLLQCLGRLSLLYPPWDGKMSISLGLSNNKMAMVDVDDSSLPADSAQVDWLGLRVGGHLALSLHSSYELSELSQWRYAMMTAP